MAGHGTKAILAAFFANLGISIAKFVGFAFTGSASMLAESIHSVADTGNQGLLLLGGRRARRAGSSSAISVATPAPKSPPPDGPVKRPGRVVPPADDKARY